MTSIHYGIATLVFVFFVACAPTRFPPGIHFLNGTSSKNPPPESLRVDLEILPSSTGSFNLQTRLYAKPGYKYRLDVMGLTSVAGTFKWDSGQWVILLHQNREIIYGQGDSIPMPGQAFVIPDIHEALGFLWEQPLPGFLNQDSGSFKRRGDTVSWSYKEENWWARLNEKTGVCLEVHSEHWSILYESWHRFGTLHLPRQAKVFLHKKLKLQFQVKHLEVNPQWKKNPFHIQIPMQYRSLQVNPE